MASGDGNIGIGYYMYSKTEVTVIASNEDKDIRIITAMTNDSKRRKRN